MSSQQIVVPRGQVTNIAFDGANFKIKWKPPGGNEQTIVFQMDGVANSFPSTDALEYTLNTVPCGQERERITGLTYLLSQVRSDTNDARAVPLFLLPHMCTTCPQSRQTLLKDFQAVLAEEDIENNPKFERLRGDLLVDTPNWNYVCREYEGILVGNVTNATGQVDATKAQASLFNMVPDFLWTMGNRSGKDEAQQKVSRLAETWRAQFRQTAREKVGGALLATGRIMPSEPRTLRARLQEFFYKAWKSLKWLLSAVSITLLLGAVIWLVGPLTGGVGGADALQSVCPILWFVLQRFPVDLLLNMTMNPVGMYSLIVGSLTMATQGGLYTLVIEYLEGHNDQEPSAVWESIYNVLSWPLATWRETVGGTLDVQRTRERYMNTWWWRLARGVLVAMPLVFITGYMYTTLVQAMIMIAIPLVIGALYAFGGLILDKTQNLLVKLGIKTGAAELQPTTQKWNSAQTMGWELLKKIVANVTRPMLRSLIRISYLNESGALNLMWKLGLDLVGLPLTKSYATMHVYELEKFRQPNQEQRKLRKHVPVILGEGNVLADKDTYNKKWKQQPFDKRKEQLLDFALSVHTEMGKIDPPSFSLATFSGQVFQLVMGNIREGDTVTTKDDRTGTVTKIEGTTYTVTFEGKKEPETFQQSQLSVALGANAWNLLVQNAMGLLNVKQQFVGKYVAPNLRKPEEEDITENTIHKFTELHGFLDWITRPSEAAELSADQQKRAQWVADRATGPMTLAAESQRDIMFGIAGLYTSLVSTLFGDDDEASD